MTGGRFQFGEFTLDLDDRRLLRGEDAVELNARYFDALALLVREHGRLVSKTRFLEEVWRGVPVTDEALTQCVRTLRRRLGDDAVRPRFIETAPKHGYRFIAAVSAETAEAEDRPPASGYAPVALSPTTRVEARGVVPTALAAAAGGAVAGVAVGLAYGLVAAARAQQAGAGALSALLVLVLVGAVLGAVAAAGVGLGIAAAGGSAAGRGPWRSVAGGAAGGLAVGGLGELVGLDAFGLLLGRSPADMTGALEGVLTGAALGAAAWLAGRVEGRGLPARGALIGAAAGGGAGVLIALFGGRLLGGSLDLLGRGFPDARLRLDGIGALLGEDGFGPLSRTVSGMLEAAVFGACFVAAVTWARRRST